MFKDRSQQLLFVFICLLLFGLAVYRIKPDPILWQYPLAPHSHNYHHTIVSAITDLYKDPNFLKGDLAIEAIKKYFLLYKYIQILCVNKLGIPLSTFVNIVMMLGMAVNFIGLIFFTNTLTDKKTAAILTLLLFLASPEAVLLEDLPINFMRVVSQGICWISLALFFRERYVASLLTCSVAFIFHYGMPFYLSLIYFFYFLLRIKAFQPKQLLGYAVLFIFATSLLTFDLFRMQLMPKDNSGFDYNLWTKIILDTTSYWSYKVSYTFLVNDFSFSVRLLNNPIFKYIVLPSLFFFVGARTFKYREKFLYLFVSYLFVQFVHFLVYDLFFIPSLVRPVLINSAYFMPFFMITVTSAAVVDLLKKEEFVIRDVLKISLLLILYVVTIYKEPLPLYVDYTILSPLFLISMVLLIKTPFFFERSVRNGRMVYYLSSLALSLTLCTLSVFYVSEVIKNKGVAKSKEYTSWLDIGLWINKNTAETDRFIIPTTGAQLAGLQIYGKRGSLEFGRLDMHFATILDPSLTKRAVREFTSLWPVPKVDGIPVNFPEYNLRVNIGLLTAIQRDGLLSLQRQYPDLRYIITDGRDIYGLPLVYQNKDYKIFGIE